MITTTSDLAFVLCATVTSLKDADEERRQEGEKDGGGEGEGQGAVEALLRGIRPDDDVLPGATQVSLTTC